VDRKINRIPLTIITEKMLKCEPSIMYVYGEKYEELLREMENLNK
jgi:hypothetical protein